jgi:hypothetical protein
MAIVGLDFRPRFGADTVNVLEPVDLEVVQARRRSSEIRPDAGQVAGQNGQAKSTWVGSRMMPRCAATASLHEERWSIPMTGTLHPLSTSVNLQE